MAKFRIWFGEHYYDDDGAAILVESKDESGATWLGAQMVMSMRHGTMDRLEYWVEEIEEPKP